MKNTDDFNEILNYSIIKLSNALDIKVITIIQLLVLVIITTLLLYLIKKAIYKSRHLDTGKKYSLNNLIRYVITIIAFGWMLQTLGFDLKIILAGSAALLVGVGLGLQNLFSDFVSGIILLIDSSIKVNDVIDVNGLICEVREINLRTTLVLTRDDKFILLPNTLLTKNELINWTHSISSSRFEVSVGVEYSSDIDLVMNVMKEICEQQEGVLKVPEPFVRFNDFGDSSLLFTVYFWCENVFRVENIKSQIRHDLFNKFRQQGIGIPFPQRVLHFPKDEEKV
ncbi:mechanosensitive ion channel domain-containing protein [uncultured Bacteroides sp.]|uniref:mechanosensitive ion channel family protein n=1 Tax=uncultured Bacteroides sp. TaxID=162156 RepID=UPI002AA854C4|nr:mechanosensitive ion channel domain-containing protein [uncultured Bacteroides sp.]